MNLVLETLNPRVAYSEKRDRERLGGIARVTKKRKVYEGGYQTVYRVWVK